MNCPKCNKKLDYQKFINFSMRQTCPKCHNLLYFRINILSAICIVVGGALLRTIVINKIFSPILDLILTILFFIPVAITVYLVAVKNNYGKIIIITGK